MSSANNLIVPDSAGNSLTVRTDGKVILSLNNHKNRNIGTLVKGTFYTRRDYNRHFFRKIQGYGFNWTLIESPLIDVNEIVLTERTEYGKMYRHKPMSIEQIMSVKNFLYFKEQNFERQVFIPLSMILGQTPWPSSEPKPKPVVPPKPKGPEQGSLF